MEYKTDLSPFFREMTRLSSEGKRFFFIINYDLTEAMLFDLNRMEEGKKGDENEPKLSFDYGFASLDQIKKSDGYRQHSPSILARHPEPFEAYDHRFGIVRRALEAGDISLINLTLATPIECDQTIVEIYTNVHAKYKVLIEDRFVCFSPERFIRIDRNGILTSHPMKGTIRADIPNAKEVILNDPKEQAEHATMVESMKGELSKVGSAVSVPRYRYIDEINTVTGGLLQVSSEVRAELPADWRDHLGEIIRKLLPAGSIAGVPKGPAIRVIEEAEQHDRGYYSGISGYFDGNELETSVLIRYIEQNPDGRLIFHSGGGVTIDSNAQREYDEVLAKIYLPK